MALLGRGCDLVVLSKLSFDMRLLGKDYNPFAKPPAVLGRLKAVERILE